MGEYLNFINEYSNKFNFDLQYPDFVNLKTYVSNMIDEILSFRGVKLDAKDAVIYFTMCFLLSNHSANEILANGYEGEIERVVEKIYDKQNEEKPKEKQMPFPEKNEAVDYIFKDLKKLSYIFKEGLNLGALSKNIRDSLNFDGYKDEEIIEGKCDQIIIEYLAKGYFDVRYTEEFKNMRVAVSNLVVSLFNYKKKDARYYSNKDNFEYKYFSSTTNMQNAIFCLTIAFIDNHVNPRKLTSSSPEMEVIQNYIQKDMIRVNSIQPKYKPMTEEERLKKVAREIQEEKKEKARRAAIILAIIFALVAVENMIYNSIHNKESKQAESRYSIETNSYDIDRVSAKIQNLRYSPSDNEAIIQEAVVPDLSVENSPIDETIEENFADEMEGEKVASL